MNNRPFSTLSSEAFAALAPHERELFLALIQAYLAEIELQQQLGIRPEPEQTFATR